MTWYRCTGCDQLRRHSGGEPPPSLVSIREDGSVPSRADVIEAAAVRVMAADNNLPASDGPVLWARAHEESRRRARRIARAVLDVKPAAGANGEK